MGRVRRVLVFLVLASTAISSGRAFAAPSLRGDTITGTLFGRVINDAQLPFPQVRIRVTNLETGNVRATVTDSSGRYRIAFLPLGLYTIDALKDGFSVSRPTRQPLKVQLNQLVEAVPDIILSPVTLAVVAPPTTPAPSPTPIVETTGRLVNRIDPTRRFNLDERQLSNLPLTRIRSFDDLALLAPGVAPPPEVKGVVGPGIGSGIGSAGQFAVNGQRARSNNFTVDGSDNNDEDVGVRRQGFVSLVPQSIESTREVQIVTNLWDAELGRNLGSQVNAVSRSGGNRVHGGLYDYFSHNALNARDFFDYSAAGRGPTVLQATATDGYLNGVPINPVRIPVMVKTSQAGPRTPVLIQNPSEGENPFQRHQFGASLGFPIRKDKGSIFVSFERQQVIDGEETHFSVPTVAERGFLGHGATGFTAADRSGAQRVFNPTFVAGDAVFSLFPFPNNPVGPFGEHTYTQVLQAGGAGTNFSLRFDEMLKSSARGTSHSLSGRYNLTSDERDVPTVGGALFSGVRPRSATQNISIFLNSQLSNRFSNQARVSYGRSRLRFEEIRDPYLTPSKLVPNEPFLLNHGMLLNGSDPRFPPSFVDYFQRTANADSAEDHLGPVGQVVVAPFSPLGVDVDLFPQRRVNNTYQFADTGVYFKGKHSVRFGFDVRRTQLNSAVNREYRAKVSFVGAPDLTTATAFDGVFQNNPTLLRGLGRLGPTPGFFSGADLAALGLPTGILQSLSDSTTPDSTIGLRLWQGDVFATDQWRIRTWFTLSYGLRYQYGTVPREVDNRIEKTFDTSSLPSADTSLSLCRPFTNCSQRFSNTVLLGAYNSTIAALQKVLDGREIIYDADQNNFAPHLGFAIDPFAKTKHAGKTVVRGGFSLNFDPVLGNVVSQSRNVYPNFVPINVDANTFSYVGQLFFIPGQTGAFAIYNPKFIPVDVLKDGLATRYPLIADQKLNAMGVTPAAFPQLSGLLFAPPPVTLGGLEFPSGAGLAFTLPEKKFRSPYAMQFNLQLEREFASQWLLNVAYVGTRGVKLTRFRTPNGGINSLTLPIDPLGLTLLGGGSPAPNAVAIAPLGFQNGRSDLGRLNPSLGSYMLFDSSASSSYHSLQTSVTKTYRDGIQVSGTYTFSKAIDDVSDVFDVAGAFVLPQDDRDLRAERGLANFDVRHRFVLSLVSELPFLRRYDNAPGVAGAVLGGWSVSLISSHQSGQPYTVNSSLDVNLDGNLTDRLDNLNGLIATSDSRVRLRLNPGVKTLDLLADLGLNGSVGRNTFVASGLHETNVSLRKNIRIWSEHTLTFRCEAFNLWNRPQFGVPVRVLEAPSFGQAVDTRLGARQIQFAIKYSF